MRIGKHQRSLLEYAADMRIFDLGCVELQARQGVLSVLSRSVIQRLIDSLLERGLLAVENQRPASGRWYSITKDGRAALGDDKFIREILGALDCPRCGELVGGPDADNVAAHGVCHACSEDTGCTNTPVKAVSDALHAAGVTKRKAQAAIVGETDVQWTRYLNGHRSPKCSKVQRWLANAAAGGYPIALTWDGVGCVVAPAGR